MPSNVNAKSTATPVPPTQPSTGQSAILTPHTFDDKDRRAFELDRKRALKPSDRALKFRTPSHRPSGNVGRNAKYRTGGKSREGNKRWQGFITPADLDLREDVDSSDDDGEKDNVEVNAHPVLNHVNLFDLVRPERKQNGISKGFELVPRLRPIMIIEDGPEEDVDALEWEVVQTPNVRSRVREKRLKKSTYASVLRAPTALRV